MKRSLFFAALAAAASLALAQSPGGPPGGSRGGPPPIDRLAQDLALTPEQQARVKAIFDAQHARREAERAQWESSGTRPTREQMQALMEQKDAELRAQLAAVLTPEQLIKFDGLRRRQRPAGPAPGTQGQ